MRPGINKRSRSKFMRETSLEFFSKQNLEQYITYEGDVAYRGEEEKFIAEGSLQPMDKGISKKILEEGIKAQDVKVFMTHVAIKTVNQFSMKQADYTFIDGIEYVAFNEADWNLLKGSQIAHYSIILVRRDKIPNGSF